MAETVVKTEDVVKEYRMGNNIVRALDGINIEIARGEYISLMGPSGSGKSTPLQHDWRFGWSHWRQGIH